MHSCKKRYFLPFYILFSVGIVLLSVIVLFCQKPSGCFMPVSADKPKAARYLLLGKDETSGLCDVVILASICSEEESICLAQIPRDTYLRYTDKSYKKINGAVSALGSPEAFCECLEKALALDIDGYVMVDLKGIRSLVDLLGGVDIDVPCDMDYDDPAQKLSIHLKKGRQRLTGAEAEQFVRFRASYLRGDIGRMDAQKLFLAAFFEKAKTLDNRDLPRLAKVAMRSVKTNIGLSQGLSLFRSMRGFDEEKITLLTLPGEDVRSRYSGAWYYVLSRSGTAAVLSDQFGVESASAAIDPGHLFSDSRREDLENIYRKKIDPEYHTVADLRREGIAIG